MAGALDQVVEAARDAAVDVVLVAGDVFELKTSTPEAVALVFDTLVRLRDTGARGVLMAHVMMDGARTGGGEQELTIGMTYAVHPSRLPGTASYVALGHLHLPQAVPAAPCPARFAGSLVQLDFGEADQDKSVVLVEA